VHVTVEGGANGEAISQAATAGAAG
jgi:hypothetical protein